MTDDWEGTRVRNGSVLINKPTIDSIPLSTAERPDIVTPKSTSSFPVYRDSNMAHAA